MVSGALLGCQLPRPLTKDMRSSMRPDFRDPIGCRSSSEARGFTASSCSPWAAPEKHQTAAA